MIQYSYFNTTDSHSYNLYNALSYCKENKISKLVFETGIYHFYGDKSFKETIAVSNHDICGITSMAFLIKEMKNFTIDGGNSLFVFHSTMSSFVILNSENITLMNFQIDYTDTMVIQAKIEEVEENFFDCCVENEVDYYVEAGKLHYTNSDGKDLTCHNIGIRSESDDRRFPKSTDECFKSQHPDLSFQQLSAGKLRIINSGLKVKKNMRIVTSGADRYACGIIIIDSKDILIQNATIYRSYGMGILGQTSENITILNVIVKSKNELLFSLNADAIHFVHCKGLIKVANCSFAEQRDDALNVHGIYSKICQKGKGYILIKYMHHQAKGLNIYRKGSRIAVLNPYTLIPYTECTICDVEVINSDYTKIYLQEDVEVINVNDLVEDINWSCDLLFENNNVFNNRGRGMLIGAKGNVQIRNNYFSVPGSAIVFENDGKKWFESGGTQNVLIEGNLFENCSYVDVWGKSVISVNPREAFNEKDYFHKQISIINNIFKGCESKYLFNASEVEKITFQNNTCSECTFETIVVYKNCKIVDE